MALPTAPVWKGSRELTLQPDFPDWNFDASQPTCVLEYQGPYPLCLSSRPANLAAVSYLGSGWYVSNSKVKRSKGGKGILTLNCAYQNPGGSSSAQDFQAYYEIEYSEINKPLEQAPIFKTGGSKALDDTDLNKILTWKNAGDFASRATAYEKLSVNAQYFVDKLKLGEETFLVTAPVIKRRSRCNGIRNINPGGKIETPPIGAALAAAWLRKGDRANRTGTSGYWNVDSEWWGADAWDADFYGRSTGTGGGAASDVTMGTPISGGGSSLSPGTISGG